MDCINKRLLNDFQRGFPLTSRPFRQVADQLGIDEAEVIERLERLRANGTISRVGGVFKPGSVGASTLAAMSIPKESVEAVAELVNKIPEVNHNYEREHRFNLWFVLTANSEGDIENAIRTIEKETGFPVMNLPLVEPYHLDLGFSLSWN